MKIAPGPEQCPKTKAFVFLVTMAFCSTHCPTLGKNTPTEALLAVKKFFQKGPGKTVLAFGVPAITIGLLAGACGYIMVKKLRERQRQQEVQRRLREEQMQREKNKIEWIAYRKKGIEDDMRNWKRNNPNASRERELREKLERDRMIEVGLKCAADQRLHPENLKKSRSFDVDKLVDPEGKISLEELEKVYILDHSYVIRQTELCDGVTTLSRGYGELTVLEFCQLAPDKQTDFVFKKCDLMQKLTVIFRTLTGENMEFASIRYPLSQDGSEELVFLNKASHKFVSFDSQRFLYDLGRFMEFFRNTLRAQRDDQPVDIEGLHYALYTSSSFAFVDNTVGALSQLKCFQGGLWDYVLNSIVQQMQEAKDNLLDPILEEPEISDFMKKISKEGGEMDPEQIKQLKRDEIWAFLKNIAPYCRHPEHFFKTPKEQNRGPTNL